MSAVVLPFRGHKWLQHELRVCVTCCGGEASLPTHCPMMIKSPAQQDAVAEGRLDYTVARGWHLTDEGDMA